VCGRSAGLGAGKQRLGAQGAGRPNGRGARRETRAQAGKPVRLRRGVHTRQRPAQRVPARKHARCRPARKGRGRWPTRHEVGPTSTNSVPWPPGRGGACLSARQLTGRPGAPLSSVRGALLRAGRRPTDAAQANQGSAADGVSAPIVQVEFLVIRF